MKFRAGTIFMLAPQRHGSNKTQSLLSAYNPSLLGPFPPLLGHWFLPLRATLGDGLVDDMVATANLSPRPLASRGGTAISPKAVRETMADQNLPCTIIGIMTAIYRVGKALMNRGDAKTLCKSPDNLLFMEEIVRHVEDATFLHLIRDPRGVWNSGRGTVRGPQTPYLAAMAWRDYHGKVRDLAKQRSIHTLRFEDLLHRPELELRRVCKLLGVPFALSMMDAHESAESQWAAKTSAQLWGNIDKPIEEGRAEAWQRELPEREVAIVESVCADLMLEFGYSATVAGRSLTRADIEFKPPIEPQSADADPRRPQLDYVSELYRRHNVMPRQRGA